MRNLTIFNIYNVNYIIGHNHRQMENALLVEIHTIGETEILEFKVRNVNDEIVTRVFPSTAIVASTDWGPLKLIAKLQIQEPKGCAALPGNQHMKGCILYEGGRS